MPCGMPPVQLVLIHHSLHKVNMKQAIYNNCDILRQSEKTMCSLRMPCLSLHIPEPYRQNLVPIWRLAAVDQVCPCRLVMVKMEPPLAMLQRLGLIISSRPNFSAIWSWSRCYTTCGSKRHTEMDQTKAASSFLINISLSLSLATAPLQEI